MLSVASGSIDASVDECPHMFTYVDVVRQQSFGCPRSLPRESAFIALSFSLSISFVAFLKWSSMLSHSFPLPSHIFRRRLRRLGPLSTLCTHTLTHSVVVSISRSCRDAIAINHGFISLCHLRRGQTGTRSAEATVAP